MENSNVPYVDLGSVTNAEVSVNTHSWGDITIWKSMYENAISDMLKKGN
jgi:hypothetical protein